MKPRRFTNACSTRKINEKIVRIFTPEETRFVEGAILGRHITKVTAMFNANFDSPASYWQIKNLCRKHEWTKSPIGTERPDPGGRIKVKTASGKWRFKNILVWEEANGKVPRGHFVIFADGNLQNTALENLLLVSAAELVFMNARGLRSTDPDMTRLGLAMAKMRIAANEAVRKKLKMRGDQFRIKEERRLKREGAAIDGKPGRL